MKPSRETVDSLRNRFAANAKDRFDVLESAIDRLRRRADDRDVLSRVGYEFGMLAGSGACFGFAVVSDRGLEGERLCEAIALAGRKPTREEIEAMGDLVDDMRTAMTARASLDSRQEESGRGVRRPVEIGIVDADQRLEESLVPFLQHEGFSVGVARTRAEASRLLDVRKPRALVVNVVACEGYGYELVDRFGGLPRLERPLLFIVSDEGSFVENVEAIRWGADGYFEKPVDCEALSTRLRALLEEEQPERARIIYVVEDLDQAAFIKAILDSAGHEVLTCTDPKRFDGELRAFQPDLIIVDALLGTMTGYEVTRYLRQKEPYWITPILLLTTKAQAQLRVEALRAGGDDYLVKPVPPEVLLTTVAARLDRARHFRTLLARDGLTHLLTRVAFHDRMATAIAKKHRMPASSAALVMIDLDYFKLVNDVHGHLVGDRVLVALSVLLRRRLRPTDAVGRLGGEEFALLLDDVDAEGAQNLVHRLLGEFSVLEHSGKDGAAFCVTFSAGVAMLDRLPMTVEEWQQAADSALYLAKASGRRCVAIS